MAPRKRTSSGGKKSSNPNREPQQSEPSKFGIQHFFERHSQTQSQKTLSQNRDDDPTGGSAANRNSRIVNRAEVGPGNPGGAASLGKIESRTECVRGVNPGSNLVNASDFVSRNDKSGSDVPVDDHIGLCRESSTKSCDDGVVDVNKVEKTENLLKAEVSTRSPDTLRDNLLPVVFDDEENQLEVTPETSKSVSVKRFKFSPGMLIKQSQDDMVDEVTWKISPVNERLHAMSKNLPGRIRVLADSTRFNSMNFQECSQEKVKISPNMSGKLEKWLSSPPLKAHKKPLICSDGLASRKLNQGHDLSCHGHQRISNSTDKSELRDSQSPFTTPPSLSCCPDKAVEEVDLKGVSNQLGSRQHKKALIELLDQVEDVISVESLSSKDRRSIAESSSSKDGRSHLDVEGCPRADLVVHYSTTNSEENRSTTDSNFNFLVLEVSEKHGPSGSSGPPSRFKVLRLLNEQNGAERVLQLWDDWYFSVVAPGDTVNVIGEFDSKGKCDVNREKNFFIVHPDILVSGTRVSASFSCPRRTILDERIKSTENSTAALMGTLLHQLFQAGLISETPSKEFLEEYARTVLQKSLESLYACGVNENDIFRTMIEAIPKLLNWISSFRDSQDSKSPTVDFKCDEGLKKVKICEVIDIEEMAWGQRYGLKGMIDASVRVRTNTNSAEANEVIMPLEFKTGKATTGQAAMEHSAQVMLYTLLMSERYMMNIEYGLLYYLHTDQTQGISIRRSDLIGLIMQRNALANDLLKASTTQQLPPMLQSPNVCRSCRHLNVCSVYHKANGGTAEGSGLGDMYDSLVSHLTQTHAIFLQKWERLIDLEAKHVEIAKKESWLSNSSRNNHHPISLSSLVLDNSDKSSERKLFRGNRFVYRFVSHEYPLLDAEQPNRDTLCASSLLEHTFRNGDYVILSTEPDHLRVANGIIVDIGNFHVSVSLGKRLRLPGHSPRSMTEDLRQQSWRIDKDESLTSFAIMRFNLIQLFLQNESSSCLRKKVVELEMPRFDSGCIFSQDPAISYVWSEKSLNDDQRRAILKILTAKDYALILGMPGTGKTSTMVHAVKALLLRGASILLTSYTNSAVDNLLIKLKAQGVDFIRIGRYEAVHEEVQENCLSVVNMDSTQEIKERLEKVKVVAVTCLGITSPLLTNKRFDICIMDEAGQITLPVSLGPLAFASRFVLVGDHYQLPPLVQSPEAKENGMSVSLFCRLSEAHPHAIAALHFQYRMCAAIMELSNALIYGNRLRCGSTEIENAKLKYRTSASSPAWLMKVLDPNQPVIFINTDLLPAYESNDRKALNNPIEAHIIAEAVKTLVLRGIEGQAIGIITPYNSQANLIRGAVTEHVEIHTIDKYQGRDKDCILVSFVRSSETPRNSTSSLLGDWHRINVALTRAKKKLIMVGSCRTLSKVPLLKLMIEKVEELCGMVVVSKKEIKYQLELKRCSQLS
ncbi:DNA replication ATP-dependent helicase/nuclease JHS1 isoform X2 [Salvia miltiorrhiza]|uniref:DNA replication ATP-dependent helicase/nuclease JHS1 isoform X2 n=1 Tax=Salvia miltiorrhiza TaxID=226208 RepID=UPI0025AB6DCB|nr:DNA replication ATP-dependent helicase/nuclease JHS1 isoform X2 [Salvia miltiorrhiza]